MDKEDIKGLASMIHLMHFYLILWRKESQALTSLLFAHGLLILFYYTNNTLGWVMIIGIVATFFQMLFFDRTEERNLFFALNKISAAERHYSKIILIAFFACITALTLLCVSLMPGGAIFDNIATITLTASTYAFFFFVKSNLAQACILLALTAISKIVVSNVDPYVLVFVVLFLCLFLHPLVLKYERDHKI